MTLVEIAAALVRTTLATSLAAIVAWALLAVLRVRSPRVHRIAWLLVIAQGWLLFPFTIEIESPAPPSEMRAAGLVPAVIQEVETDAIPFENETQRGRGLFATGEFPIVEASPSQKVPDPLPLAITAWLLGAFTLVIIALYRYLRVIRTLPLGSSPDNPQWQAEWDSACNSAKLRPNQTVTLRITAALGPLLHWAPWAYFILVPRPLWSNLEQSERSAILRHELAHLRRGDLWKSLAIRGLALPQWFNPLVWLAVRRFDEAAEWACDDAAARDADDRLALANSLLQSAEYALAPYPASAPAARGLLTRRIHRLVSPRFKEESKMKLLVLPLLLLLAAVGQTIRIERVIAEAPQQPPSANDWPPSEQFNMPLGGRLNRAEQRHARLLIERQRAVDAETRSSHAVSQDGRRPGPPASTEQMNFDQLAREFENFARMKYVIEPPDVLLIRIATRLSKSVKRRGPIANVDIPLIQIAAGMSEAPKRVLVDMEGKISLDRYKSVSVLGMTLDETKHAIEDALDGRGVENDVQVSVDQFNSKVYYVITEGVAEGDDVTRVPIPYPVDGKETIGAAIRRVYGDPKDLANPNGLLANAAITLHRVALKHPGASRIYAIEWNPALKAPTPLTNHCLLPGDRIFIRSKESVERRTVLRAEAAPTPPEEVNPKVLPRYYVEPNHAPTRQSTYRLRPYDTINLRVERPHRPAYTLTWGDIGGEFTVTQFGDVELGGFGIVDVAGLTVDEAGAAIEQRLREKAPRCEVSLTLGMLAEEKYVISIQRTDGTEVAAGALSPADFSESEFLDFRKFVTDLASISGVKLERKAPDGATRTIWMSTIWDAVQAPTLPPCEYRVRGGDRLVLTVDQDWKTHRYPPAWLVPSNAESDRDYGTFRFHPGWRALYSTQFDHPDVQLPEGLQYTR